MQLKNLNTGEINDYTFEDNVHYVIEKAKKEGIKKKLHYDKVIYYDIETVSKEDSMNGIKSEFETIEEEMEESSLNLSNNIIFSLSVLIPKSLVLNKRKKEFQFNNGYSITETKEFYIYFYYNEDHTTTLNKLVELILYVNEVKNGRKRDTTLQVCGFKNNTFDDLIFKFYNEKVNLYIDNRNKYNKLIINEEKINLIDISRISKTMGFTKLEQLGEDIGFDKLKIENGYEQYNNRDVEILFWFLKMCNEQLGLYQWNTSAVARKDSIDKLTNKLNVETLTSDTKINNFRLTGGRTENFIHYAENVKYIDFNSLYPSATTKLDVIIPETYTNKKGKRVGTYKLNNVFGFNSIIEEIENISFKDPLNLEKEYPFEMFYLMKVRIFDIKPEYKKALHISPFSYKDKVNDKIQWKIKKNGIYEIGFCEIMFLKMFDFEILDCYSMFKGEDPLKEYREDLYEQRTVKKSQKDKKERFYKILLNTGYGIFASNKKNERIKDKKILDEIYEFDNWDKIAYQYNRDTFMIKRIGTEYFKTSINKKQKWNVNTIPVYAMNITSNARFMMYKVFLFLMQEGDITGIYYTDTDSIILSQENYDLLEEKGVLGKGLGKMSDEHPNENIDYIKCFAPKSYEYQHSYIDENGKKISKIKKVFKGTGEELERKIYQQSINQDFSITKRKALNPEQDQKRILVGNIFVNKQGKSEDLIKVWNTYLEESKSA